MSKNIAFIFPGQGSQTIGMLDSFKNEAIIKQTLEQASEALKENIGSIIDKGPSEQLNSTIYTQPIMLACSIAIYRLWLERKALMPNIMAGHSLGEYSALTASGVIDFPNAVKLVRFRAKAMQEAVAIGNGSMAAIIGLDSAVIIEVCEQINKSYLKDNLIVQAANFNSLEQTVIAGNIKTVNAACEILKQKGAKRAIILPVSAPFHCSLLYPAGQALKEYLANIKFNKPSIDVINNVDTAIYTNEQAIKDALVRQVYNPVRWVEIIQKLAVHTEYFIEVGVGKVLQGLVKRIIPINSAAVLTTDTLDNFNQSINQICS